ncbi:MAG: response regulator [Roseburia sp.]|nr:response regulator [Roseburia sp.]MCM1097139.1 response regulator [Ruminococcus flavefaciens]
MGKQLSWQTQYELGVEVLDNEHKKLFRILNKLLVFEKQKLKSQWVCREAVKYFKDHTLQHFLNEEEYMESVQYEGREMHKRIHKNFRETTLPALEKELEQTRYSDDAMEHFIGVCTGWLVGHTLIEDRAIISGEPLKQWENLMPEEEQAVMGQAIADQLYNMFRLKPHMVSNCYGGEKFGEGIYYRLIYQSKDKKRWEFFLIFEEKLIVSTMGSVIDMEAKAINAMMMNATRYTARQFIGRIKEHFPSLWNTEVQTEQLLTYDQFQKIFEKNSPQFSLLFDTGSGYFAYCMTTTDVCMDEDNASIITENAMEKVESYLKHNEEEKAAVKAKKKLLVVDDSEFMLQVMQKLFNSDYEVMTALSGMSAFRSIALSKPDLILLDYEMPVCRGDQVLEMIRAEKEYKDVPVFFLTSRVDRESVEKVIALKPQGYLTKSLAPEEIKKEVDRFFEGKKYIKV